MDNLIVRPQPKTSKPLADLVQPSLLSLLPKVEELPAEPKPLVLRTQAAPNDRRQSLKRFQCPEGMSYCPWCDQYKDLSHFRKDKSQKRGVSRHCKDCLKSYANRYQERRMHEKRKQNYGLTPEQYKALHDAQGGLCAICGQAETRILKGVKVDLSVDHDHATGDIRGLLCGRCNSALGHFGDNIKLMQSAIEYIRYHNDEK